MRRVIAFALVLVCCAGLLMGTHRAVRGMEEAVAFTENVVYGSPTVLDGRSLNLSFYCGQHMTWDSRYSFGETGSSETEFVFSQTEREQVYANASDFGIGLAEFGIIGGDMKFDSSPFGYLLQAAADQTSPGETRTVKLRVAEYLDEYYPCYGISYNSEAAQCEEWVDTSDILTPDGADDRGSYWAFNRTFQFPVAPEDVAQVEITKASDGSVNGVSMDLFTDGGEESMITGPNVSMVSALNDDGCYLLPRYYSADGTPRTVNTPKGDGIYFVPWKQTGTVRDGTREISQVSPDYANAKRIYALDEGVEVLGMEVSENADTAWLITLEDGNCAVTVLDLQNQTCRGKVSVFPVGEEETVSWVEQDGWILVSRYAQIVLVDGRENGEAVFSIPALNYPECMNLIRYCDVTNCRMEFDGENLILADPMRNGDDGAFQVMVLSAEGARFLGQYRCSLLEQAGGYSYQPVYVADGSLELQ